ncbi:MAG: UDP-N-acetylmuramate dehydrogenase [Bacilli bacterium]
MTDLNYKTLITELKKMQIGIIEENVSLKKYTTYSFSNTANILVNPLNTKKLIKLLKYLKKINIKYKIIGGGSNLIFKSNYEGVLIKLDYLNELNMKENIIEVGSGYSLMKLAIKMSKLGLTGLEFATGIPGTVGGAIFNNAGAYQSDMGYIVKKITVLDSNYKIKIIENKDAKFHYRTSFFKENPNYIILSTLIELKFGDVIKIMEVIEDRRIRRKETQPIDCKSAGSVFRNTLDVPAWKLIDDAHLKGKQIGGAKVSDKHANFIVNENNATGEDVIDLINEIKNTIKEKFDIDLILEQEIVE